jgi:hypothetical protein
VTVAAARAGDVDWLEGDFEVSEDVAVETLVTALEEAFGLGPTGVGRVLRRPAGTPFDPVSTFCGQGVVDGERLLLVPVGQTRSHPREQAADDPALGSRCEPADPHVLTSGSRFGSADPARAALADPDLEEHEAQAPGPKASRGLPGLLRAITRAVRRALSRARS